MILNNFFSTKKVAEETKFVKICPSEKVKETLKVMKPKKKWRVIRGDNAITPHKENQKRLQLPKIWFL